MSEGELVTAKYVSASEGYICYTKSSGRLRQCFSAAAQYQALASIIPGLRKLQYATRFH
jgi:hypothetical protein